MSEAEARPTNFIRQIIDEDLASGKHTTVHTRFPPEPNGYLHIGHAEIYLPELWHRARLSGPVQPAFR
ncbi:hypothetical protein LFZ31_02270, partial [Salmonella enterica subsp. enterica serovar Newport str. S09097]